MGRHSQSLKRLAILSGIAGLFSCALAVTRPVQEMSDTAAALKAAKEVGADTLAPELYRRAVEAYFRARNEYQMKNFSITKEYAAKAKRLAEDAEFEALRLGASRSSVAPAEEPPKPPAEPYAYPTPTGTPAFILNQMGGSAGTSPNAPQGSSAAPPPP